MKKIFITLLLIFGIVMCGFSKQYVKMYWYDNVFAKVRTSNFVKDLSIELANGAKVIQITSIINPAFYGSKTCGFIVVYDDGK